MSNEKEKWEELYLLVAIEVDGKKMPDRIAAAREAIQGRLQDLMQSSDHHDERRRLKDTMERLNVVEAESREW